MFDRDAIEQLMWERLDEWAHRQAHRGVSREAVQMAFERATAFERANGPPVEDPAEPEPPVDLRTTPPAFEICDYGIQHDWHCAERLFHHRQLHERIREQAEARAYDHAVEDLAEAFFPEEKEGRVYLEAEYIVPHDQKHMPWRRSLWRHWC